jgi:hypothetical protein
VGCVCFGCSGTFLLALATLGDFATDFRFVVSFGRGDASLFSLYSTFFAAALLAGGEARLMDRAGGNVALSFGFATAAFFCF